MQYLYSININVEYCLKYGISFEHACILKLMILLPNRATRMDFEEKSFYRLNLSKIIEELPMISSKKDTIYRYIKKLCDIGIIEKVPKLDYYRCTEIGLAYEYKSDTSDINPIGVGNKSDSEIDPTYDNTIEFYISNNDNTNEYLKIIKDFINEDHFQNKYLIQKKGIDLFYIDQIKEFERLVKKGFSAEIIGIVLQYIKQDDFWSTNILSVAKLNKKNKDGVPYIVFIMDQMKNRKQQKQTRQF